MGLLKRILGALTGVHPPSSSAGEDELEMEMFCPYCGRERDYSRCMGWAWRAKK